MPDPVKVLAVLNAKPGKVDELRALVSALVPPSRAEPGNLRYDLWWDPTDPARVVIDELYENDAANLAHRATPHFQGYLARIGNLADRSAFALSPLDVR